MMAGWRDRNKQRKRRTVQTNARTPLIVQPLFAPMLGLWGAALGGLTVLVLPQWRVAGALAGTGLAALGAQAQFVLAGAAALLLGGGLFAVAASLSHRARIRAAAPTVAEMAARRIRPIDPTRELGSGSLDEPVIATPFAPNPFADDPAPEPEFAPPRALDLSEFAELPGRNAVWVEEPAALPVAPPSPLAEPSAVSLVQAVAFPDPGTAALARLRATPPDQLSLVQMVERFAAALHEHRTTAHGNAGHNRDLAARDAALAEALKALATLSDQPSADPQAQPLRDAFGRLQGLRGAA